MNFVIDKEVRRYSNHLKQKQPISRETDSWALVVREGLSVAMVTCTTLCSTDLGSSLSGGGGDRCYHG